LIDRPPAAMKSILLKLSISIELALLFIG